MPRYTIALAALLLLPVACGTPPMSLEQQAAHAEALADAVEAQDAAGEAQAAELQAEALLVEALARATELEASLAAFEATPASASPDQVKALVAELSNVSSVVGLAKEAQAQADAQLAAARTARAVAEDRAADIEAEAAQAAGGTIMDLVGAVFPPVKGLGDAWLLLSGLLFKRPRERLAAAAKEVIETAGGALTQNPIATLARARALLRTVGSVIGLKHTTEDPAQLIANAASLAAKSPGVDLEKAAELLAVAYHAKLGELGVNADQSSSQAAG